MFLLFVSLLSFEGSEFEVKGVSNIYIVHGLALLCVPEQGKKKTNGGGAGKKNGYDLRKRVVKGRQEFSQAQEVLAFLYLVWNIFWGRNEFPNMRCLM